MLCVSIHTMFTDSAFMCTSLITYAHTQIRLLSLKCISPTLHEILCICTNINIHRVGLELYFTDHLQTAICLITTVTQVHFIGFEMYFTNNTSRGECILDHFRAAQEAVMPLLSNKWRAFELFNYVLEHAPKLTHLF